MEQPDLLAEFPIDGRAASPPRGAGRARAGLGRRRSTLPTCWLGSTRASVPCSRVNSAKDIFADEHMRARDNVIAVPGPDGRRAPDARHRPEALADAGAGRAARGRRRSARTTRRSTAVGSASPATTWRRWRSRASCERRAGAAAAEPALRARQRAAQGRQGGHVRRRRGHPRSGGCRPGCRQGRGAGARQGRVVAASRWFRRGPRERAPHGLHRGRRRGHRRTGPRRCRPAEDRERRAHPDAGRAPRRGPRRLPGSRGGS